MGKKQLPKSKEELITKALESLNINKLNDAYIDESKYKKFLINEICNIGIASRDIELLVQQIVNPGGPGLYRVTFEKGVKGTLAKFLDGSGFSSNVIEAGKKGVKSRARLNPELFNPSMIFLEIAIHRLEAELGEIKDICQNIFNKLVDNDHNQIQTNYKELLDISQYHKYNIEDDSWCDAQLKNCIDISKSSDTLFRNTATNIGTILKKLKGIHINENEEILKSLFEEIAFLQLTLICYAVSNYYKLFLKNGYVKEELDGVVDKIQQQSVQYSAYVKICSNAYCKYVKNMKIPKFILKEAPSFLTRLGLAIFFRSGAPLTGIYAEITENNELVDLELDERTQELVKAFTDKEKSQFLELNKNINQIDSVSSVYENNNELYLDDKYIYIKNANG